MAFTDTQLAALDKAIASGVLSVDIDGVRTTYQSLDAMLKLRNLMLEELGQQSETRQRRTLAIHSRD